LYRRALAIREQRLGPDHPDTAASLNALGGLYKVQARYADAEPLFRKSLAINEKAFGSDHQNVAQSLTYLAQLYEAQGRYADAEPLYKRSLAIYEKTHGPDHPYVATLLNSLAGLYRAQGRYADAEPLYERSLAIREKALGADHPHVALSLNDLAVLYDDQGRYADIEPLYKRCLAIYEKALGRDHIEVARSLNNLASLYLRLGRYADSEPLYKRALAIKEKALGREHPDVALSLNSLANLYKVQARYADAEPFYKRSLAIRERSLGFDHPEVALALNSLAELYRGRGRYASAEPLYERSLALRERTLGPDHPVVAESLNNLALLYQAQGRYADADPLYKRSLAILEKTYGPDDFHVASTLNNLALLEHARGRYADAELLYKRSLVIREKALAADHPTVATTLSNLAALYRNQGRYADAEPLYERSLTIVEKGFGPDHPSVVATLNDLADLYSAQGRYADALPIIKRTISQGSSGKWVAFPVLFHSQMQHLVDSSDALIRSYDVFQRDSSSAAANAVSKLAARFAAGNGELAQLVRKDQDLTNEEQTLDETLIAASSKPPAERNASAEDRNRKRMEAIRSERQGFEIIFGQRYPDYVAFSKPQPLSLNEVQGLLADDEALILLDFAAKSYAWIITRTDADWTELKISGVELAAQVRALRAWLTDPRRRFDPALAYKIYQATFGAFADRIASKARLSVVTNGALTSLPPALFVTKDPTGKPLRDVDWLIRSHSLTILPSVASLKVLRGSSQTSSAQKSMIAFADPVFSRDARQQAEPALAMRSIASFYRGLQIDLASLRERLVQLPGTRTEVLAVAKILSTDPGDIKLGLAASESAVKQATLDGYRIVYFATHGLVSGELELFSKSQAEPALALTIPDEPDDFDDGLLMASEVAQLKLDADWVVLSACNTAAEEKPGAEALSGLARAFFYAGAKSLIVSHWSVSDEATARLMIGTFRASSSDPKLSHAEALRQSMLAMIDAARSDDEANPRFWAPFVVVGEPAKPQ
jgi:CHAT domain-containing protein/tetratricopeptide (TPR) repeat protein